MNLESKFNELEYFHSESFAKIDVDCFCFEFMAHTLYAFL